VRKTSRSDELSPTGGMMPALPRRLVSEPISPPPVTKAGRDDLPPYVSYGLIGLRVMDLPVVPGIAIVSGLGAEHPLVRVEAAARAAYPVAGDIALGGI
jgi:hypothetical protein